MCNAKSENANKAGNGWTIETAAGEGDTREFKGWTGGRVSHSTHLSHLCSMVDVLLDTIEDCAVVSQEDTVVPAAATPQGGGHIHRRARMLSYDMQHRILLGSHSWDGGIAAGNEGKAKVTGSIVAIGKRTECESGRCRFGL